MGKKSSFVKFTNELSSILFTSTFSKVPKLFRIDQPTGNLASELNGNTCISDAKLHAFYFTHKTFSHIWEFVPTSGTLHVNFSCNSCYNCTTLQTSIIL